MLVIWCMLIICLNWYVHGECTWHVISPSTAIKIYYMLLIWMMMVMILHTNVMDSVDTYVNTYECWKRLRHLLQWKSLSKKPTSPHMQHTFLSRSTILVSLASRRWRIYEGEEERWEWEKTKGRTDSIRKEEKKKNINVLI